ncbi:hypothetical protein [Massilia sp. BJB1822]|uniref:hypothetical protein n=1 Tax=Massilia sp. BJB1822 TaxID=2744470 RepID=UPI0015931556|nr:hypothetical protein [Massilia sp. BJB1822]NVD97942.1 hypothetical protein [Massilia sp. BJB1822]
MNVSKKSGRLGTRLRGKLASAYGQRGHHNSPLWYVYSPRTDRDWVIRSDLGIEHFVLTEADSDVIDVDYSPELEIPALGAVKFDAIVRYRDGAVQWHHVSNGNSKANGEATTRLQLLSDAAEHAGAHLLCIDHQYLNQNPQRLWNWQRAIAWMSAARGTALAPYMTELGTFVHAREVATLGEITQLGPRERSALYVAAAFRLAQQGDFNCDLDERPLSSMTTFVARG